MFFRSYSITISLFYILHLTVREIVQFAITTNPTREFVRQQLIEFEQKVNQVVYMIHDHAAQFNINYIEYGIKSIKTSVETPNMNAIAERFVGSVPQEVLDFYLLINEKQIQRILSPLPALFIFSVVTTYYTVNKKVNSQKNFR